jgi:hypothetical protein
METDKIGSDTEQAWARFFGVQCSGGYGDRGVDILVDNTPIQVKTSMHFALRFWAESIMYFMQTGRKPSLRHLVVGDPPVGEDPKVVLEQIKRDLFWVEKDQAHMRTKLVQVRYELLKCIK